MVDEKGKYAISVLSGHMRGANELAKTIAKRIGAKPVITTATDIHEKPCVEYLAKKFNFSIKNLENIKRVNAAIVNGEKVCIYSDFELNLVLPRNMFFYKFSELNPKNDCDALIIITSKNISKLKKPHVILRPRKNMKE